MVIGVAQAQTLPPCTATGMLAQEAQSNCLVANPGGQLVITSSNTEVPTYVDTPVSQRVDQYQTTLIARSNSGVIVFQQTFAAAFNDPSVQSAVTQEQAQLSIQSAPLLASSSTALQSSLVSYVQTSPTPTINSSCIQFGVAGTGTCSGVMVTDTTAETKTFGPATIMIGENQSDEFIVAGGQEAIDVNDSFSYVVTRNVVTTNTYLTAQTYVLASFSPCDVNRDGKTSVADIQGTISEALGAASPANDLNGDGVVNVVDVQIVLNGVLNLGCTVPVGARPVATPESEIVRPARPVGGNFVVAGNGSPGYKGDGGLATSAEIANPAGVAVDRAGNVYIADAGNHRVRKVALDGVISTVAGNGDAGYLNPLGVAVDAAGSLYIADAANNRIRKVGPGGAMSTVAGNGISGYSGDGGPATEASLNYPSGLAVDAAGNLFIADTYNQRIRKVAVDGTISLVAGNGNAGYSDDGGAATSASLYVPVGVAVDVAGVLYIADSGNRRVRKVGADGRISTEAGGLDAAGVAVDLAGNLYIAESRQDRIRRVGVKGEVSTVNVTLSGPSGAAVDAAGNLYIADMYGQVIREMVGEVR